MFSGIKVLAENGSSHTASGTSTALLEPHKATTKEIWASTNQKSKYHEHICVEELHAGLEPRD